MKYFHYNHLFLLQSNLLMFIQICYNRKYFIVIFFAQDFSQNFSQNFGQTLVIFLTEVFISKYPPPFVNIIIPSILCLVQEEIHLVNRNGTCIFAFSGICYTIPSCGNSPCCRWNLKSNSMTVYFQFVNFPKYSSFICSTNYLFLDSEGFHPDDMQYTLSLFICHSKISQVSLKPHIFASFPNAEKYYPISLNE